MDRRLALAAIDAMHDTIVPAPESAVIEPVAEPNPYTPQPWRSPTAIHREEMAQRPMRERFTAALGEQVKRRVYGKAARAKRDRRASRGGGR